MRCTAKTWDNVKAIIRGTARRLAITSRARKSGQRRFLHERSISCRLVSKVLISHCSSCVCHALRDANATYHTALRQAGQTLLFVCARSAMHLFGRIFLTYELVHAQICKRLLLLLRFLGAEPRIHHAMVVYRWWNVCPSPQRLQCSLNSYIAVAAEKSFNLRFINSSIEQLKSWLHTYLRAYVPVSCSRGFNWWRAMSVPVGQLICVCMRQAFCPS